MLLLTLFPDAREIGLILATLTNGWRFQRLLGFRLRGNLRIARIAAIEEEGQVVTQAPPAGHPIEPRLTVIYAKYGAGPGVADVTEKVRSLVVDDRLQVLVSNNLVPQDPYPKMPKVLEVEYAYDGVKTPVRTKEGGMLVLPPT